MNRWRGPIGVEGVTTTDGRLVEAGAFVFDTPLPLVADNATYGPIGTVETIERGDGGVLIGTGEISTKPEHFGLAITADAAEADVVEGEGRVMVIHRARIRAVYLTEHPVWPECKIEVVE